MKPLDRVVYPGSVDEALAALAEREDAAPLAGGTTLTLFRSPRIRTLVDLGHLPLDRIERDNGHVVVGATARVQQVAESPLLADVAGGVVGAACARIGSRLIRNAVMVGGNVVQVYPWSDLPVVLRVLDAQVVVQNGADGERRLGADEFFAKHPRRILKRGDLVTAVRLPVSGSGEGASWLKFTRTVTDYALASTATWVALDPDGRCRQIRIALGAVVATPVRASTAEVGLRGQMPDETTLARAAHQAAQAIEYRSDFRASKSYRREICETLVRRALVDSVERARGKEGGQ